MLFLNANKNKTRIRLTERSLCVTIAFLSLVLAAWWVAKAMCTNTDGTRHIHKGIELNWETERGRMSRGSSEGVLVMFMLQTEGTHVTCFHLYKSNGMQCLRKTKNGGDGESALCLPLPYEEWLYGGIASFRSISYVHESGYIKISIETLIMTKLMRWARESVKYIKCAFLARIQYILAFFLPTLFTLNSFVCFILDFSQFLLCRLTSNDLRSSKKMHEMFSAWSQCDSIKQRKKCSVLHCTW